MPLLARGHWHGSRFRCAQIASGFLLVYGPHHQLKEQVIATGIELDGLADVAIFLVDSSVVRGHCQGELSMLVIGLLQLQADRAHRLRVSRP